MAEYTASQSLPPGRTVRVLSFRHPLRKDRRGKLGLKIRCSLETPDEQEAERLKDQMNELLADTNLHSILKQREAERDSIVWWSTHFMKGSTQMRRIRKRLATRTFRFRAVFLASCSWV